MTAPPPASVLAAFGLTGSERPRRLSGGQGHSWRVGGAVLKPLDAAPAAMRWQADLRDTLVPDGFRVARALRTGDGDPVADGWCAWQYLPGAHAPRFAEIVEVSERLHRALAGVPRPSAILDADRSRWAVADRAAWGEVAIDPWLGGRHVAELAAARRPVESASQLIHGDLAGNVLFAGELPPAIIDISPRWRPADYQTLLVVGDALTWERADASLLQAVEHIPSAGQLLLRALLFRRIVEEMSKPGAPPAWNGVDVYSDVVPRALALAGG